jgi:hypothetical protein
MMGLMLVTNPLLHSTDEQPLPAECVNADSKSTGRPIMFPARDGLSFGISTPHTTLVVDDPVLIYVWVNNQTDKEKVLGSCTMWWGWGVTVYDSQWHEIKTHTEQEQERRGEQPVPICTRNVALRIPPHSCGLLRDIRDVSVDLREDRDLPAGEYFVTEKRLTSSGQSLMAKSTRWLKIVITEKKSPS